jgi:hypothetical protein
MGANGNGYKLVEWMGSDAIFGPEMDTVANPGEVA